MNQPTLPCDRRSLHLFLEERLSGPEQIDFERHLDGCPACRAALDELVAGPEAWHDARAYLSDVVETPPERSPIADVECYRKLLGPTDDPAMMGRIGGYEIVGILGAGGMGVVFKGFDLSLNRYVAIKMLSPLLSASGLARQRFLREAQSAAAVIHENVVAIHSIAEWQGTPYLVMTYIRGESLRSRLARRGTLSLRELLRVGMQIASGLAAAHSQGLIHRDIKPANILLETEVDRLKISDFGLARAVDDVRLTKSDTLLGTPQYMSPEQARDDALDYRTDMFSLGSILYEASTGRPPFHASTSYSVLRRIVECCPQTIRQLNPDLPEWFERLVNRLMEKDRDARFATAAELETVLRQCLAHVEQPLNVSLPHVVSAPEARRHRFSLQNRRLVMSLAAVSLSATVGWFLFAQLGQVGRDKVSEQQAPKAAAKAAATLPAGERPTTRAGNYKIEVLGVADVSGMPMTTEFDLSRMKMKQQFQTFGDATSGNANNGTSGGFTAGSAGGTAGGAGGGFGTTFHKPNLGIALSIEPIKTDGETIVKVNTKATARDDKGNTIESRDLGPGVPHFARFENEYPGAQALYLYQAAQDGTRIVRLEGELLLIPGRKLSVTFDGTRQQTKHTEKEAFKLESVTTNADGIEINVAFPPSRSVKAARTPQERFQAMVANRGSYSAAIEDNTGEVHQSTKVTSAGGSVTSTFTSNSNGVQGVVKTPDNPTQSFGFLPLPEGQTIKSIRVSFEDRTGEPKPLAFTLENIPLK